MSKFGRFLTHIIWNFIPPSREPDFLIGPSDEDPYMKRWWVIPRNRFFNIYLHHMLHDDDDRAAHDHPWWSLSLCIDGVIDEHELIPLEDPRYADGMHVIDENFMCWQRNLIVEGDFKWRGKNYAHRLTLPKGEAWTLFITGPVIRTWGFHCPKGWVPWKDFVNSDKPGQPGRGCGEIE